MKKQDFIRAVAESADVSQNTASDVFDAVVGTITDAMKNDDKLTFVGFGTFSVKARAARQGRNPRTGETIEIKAAKIPSFKAGKALKDAVN
ncbi:HU family DNA-binding protein [Marinicella rhabdoformis]|uniref:HU family DNA-binding protein n=1 Tax=Marinicella rhabdoformis TaxID=2580566 RepID=UPI0012AEB410|nr:HU family DNA-binding protein [Marinicella rhabdoformis]